MSTISPKRVAIACLILAALTLLSACTLTFPQLGGVKDANPTAVEGSQSEIGTPPAGETPSNPDEIEATTSSPDQPVIDTAISAEDFNDPENPPHGLILFASTSAQPFLNAASEGDQDTQLERSLWAISLDGKRAGRISLDGTGSALYVANTPGQKSKVLQNGFYLVGEQIEPVDLPDECANGGEACSGFQFSPDGKMLAYFTGSGSCGRRLALYNVTERKPIHTWPDVHWAYFFKNGSLLVSLGDCDRQTAYLYVPKTGKQAGVEKVGKTFWNPTRTAVILQVQGEPELQTGLWGFNLETSRVFLWPSKETVIEDTPIWLDDGQHFVFQHQPYTYDKATQSAKLTGPRQVILMDAWTGSQRLLGYDARSNYHLCGVDDLQGSAPGSPCVQAYGEWLRIQRLPFRPLRFALADQGEPEARCALYGLDCEGQPEILGLNWQTGKQYPWEEAHIPEAIPTPGYNQPDLNKEPFYQDPDGQFAFYIGKDGRTLWYVPRDREPSLWVQDAEGFVYLP